MSKKEKLTQKETDMLWGGEGPYSQAKLIKEVRILDGQVSRTFIIVEADINPTTFKLIKKNRNHKDFKNDAIVQLLLDNADYRGPEFGYVSMGFSAQFTDSLVLAEAELALNRCQKTIIKMHKFIMKNFL